ncbi:MAG: HAMP domain-containing protein [Magnetococcales bacterium]|nr:HAMP domain-containing protein [Magnetococcales bacterium]
MKFSKTARRGLIVALLGAVVTITVVTGWGLSGAVAMTGGEYKATFLVLLSINLFLALVLGFVVVRNLGRLWLAQRKRLAGSQLRTRMALLFVALSLFPTLVLSILSLELLNRGVDSWFSERISQSMSYSLDVARAYYQENQRTVRHDAEDIRRNRNVAASVVLQGGEAATAALEVERTARSLDEIAIFRNDGSRIATAGEMPFDPMPDLSSLKAGDNRALMVTNDDGTRIRAIVRLGDNLYLSAGRWVDRQVLAQMEVMESAYVDYNQLRDAHGLLKVSHTFTLILIALLLLLAAVWSGFRIAGNISRPIIELVIGTRKVASGDLTVTLPVRGSRDDELTVLTTSFNAMTRKLSENQQALKVSNALLEERRHFMEAIVANISAGVISVNRFDEITLMNPAAGDLLGVECDNCLGTSFKETIPESVRESLQPLMEGAGTQSKQVQVSGPEEHPRTLMARVTVLEDGEGQSQGFIATFDDLTEVLVAQRTRAWSDVARRIAHEIKNPLTPIQLWAQRLRRKYLRQSGDSAPDWRVLDEGTHAIINQVEELRVLVNEFSTFARLPRPHLKEDDLNEAVGEVVTLFKGELKGVSFDVEKLEPIPLLLFDRGQIKQVITNLLTNALAGIREADDDGQKQHLAITTHLSKNGDWALIEVADSGRGIPPTERDRVFEPYFTTKKKGSGLGLAIVKKIVEDHGGFIQVLESQWQGALVQVKLPINR